MRALVHGCRLRRQPGRTRRRYRTGANGSYALAASRGNLAVAAVLASLYPVVTALLARGILAERLRPVQSMGVVAALGGVLLLSS